MCAGEFQLGRAYSAKYWDGAAHSAVHGGLRELTEEDYSCNAAAPISSAFSGVIARGPARTPIGLFTCFSHEKRDCQPLLDIKMRKAIKSDSHLDFKLFLHGLEILATCS